MYRLAAATLAVFIVPCLAQAQSLLEWQSANIQILRGAGYELSDDRTQTTLTFEYANGWTYGDTFFYLDWTPDQPEETNAELSPRLSLGKITGRDLSFGPVKDVLLSATWEKAVDFDAYLYGAALDLDVPGFAFFQANLYRRDDPDTPGKGWQATFVWSRPFQIGGRDFTFGGFADYANYEGGSTNLFTQPQILMDVGDLAGVGKARAYAGIEWRYWHNKFGVDGVNESAPQAVFKWIF